MVQGMNNKKLQYVKSNNKKLQKIYVCIHNYNDLKIPKNS